MKVLQGIQFSITNFITRLDVQILSPFFFTFLLPICICSSAMHTGRCYISTDRYEDRCGEVGIKTRVWLSWYNFYLPSRHHQFESDYSYQPPLLRVCRCRRGTGRPTYNHGNYDFKRNIKQIIFNYIFQHRCFLSTGGKD